MLLPKLYNGRDKAFFFASYQETLERRTPKKVERIVPTAAQQRGDFSVLRTPLGELRGGTHPAIRFRCQA